MSGSARQCRGMDPSTAHKGIGYPAPAENRPSVVAAATYQGYLSARLWAVECIAALFPSAQIAPAHPRCSMSLPLPAKQIMSARTGQAVRVSIATKSVSFCRWSTVDGTRLSRHCKVCRTPRCTQSCPHRLDGNHAQSVYVSPANRIRCHPFALPVTSSGPLSNVQYICAGCDICADTFFRCPPIFHHHRLAPISPAFQKARAPASKSQFKHV